MNTIKYMVKKDGKYCKKKGRWVQWTDFGKGTIYNTYFQAKKRADLELATVVSVEIREVILCTTSEV